MENSNSEPKKENNSSTENKKEEIKDDTGPISPEDLQTPEVKDSDNDIKQNENDNNNKEEKKEEKEEYNEIISEFDNIFKQIESKDSNKALFNLCDKLKNKYKEKLIKDNIPIEKEQILINFSLYLFFNLSHKLNKDLSESFDSICLNI